MLAAGGSTRLGFPKQLLRRAGEPLVSRAVRLAADTAPDRLVVLLGGYRDAVAAALTSAPGERSRRCRKPRCYDWRQPTLQRDLDTPDDVRQAQADGLLDHDR